MAMSVRSVLYRKDSRQECVGWQGVCRGVVRVSG